MASQKTFEIAALTVSILTNRKHYKVGRRDGFHRLEFSYFFGTEGLCTIRPEQRKAIWTTSMNSLSLL